jgi:hypothetical protein
VGTLAGHERIGVMRAMRVVSVMNVMKRLKVGMYDRGLPEVDLDMDVWTGMPVMFKLCDARLLLDLLLFGLCDAWIAGVTVFAVYYLLFLRAVSTVHASLRLRGPFCLFESLPHCRLQILNLQPQ